MTTEQTRTGKGLDMKRIAYLGILVLSLGLLPTGPTGRTARADTGFWTLVPGSEAFGQYNRRTDVTGYLNRVDEIANDINPAILRYARLTSGSCDDYPDQAYVFEGQLNQDGSRYTGLLNPTGKVTQDYPAITQAVVDIGAAGSGIFGGRVLTTGFVNGPAYTYFSLCLRQPDPPGTYCFVWKEKDTVLCQRQVASSSSPQAPVTLSAGGPYCGVTNEPVTFTPTLDNMPPGVDYVITWNFGDGTTKNGATVTHAYAGPGEYQVTASLALYPSGIRLAESNTTVSIRQPGQDSSMCPAVNAPPSTTNPVVNAPPSTTSPAAGWTLVGSATSDDAGAWRFTMNAGQDLIGAGLTVMRVTSGTCDSLPDEAVVFEAQLQATEAGDQSWGGTLVPVGAPAQSLPALDPNGGDVHFIPTPAGTLIDTGLDGVPPDTTFAVCLRRP